MNVSSGGKAIFRSNCVNASMSIFYAFFTAMLIGINPVALMAQEYVLIWNDEFNMPGVPDSTKWAHEIGQLRNNELQYYTDRYENARIEDTVLIIETRKEDYEGASYTSASLRSNGKGDWKYGKVEISAKVPAGKGTWVALWMMPTYSRYGSWPRSGEIDMVEYIGVEPENLFYNVHFEGTDGSGHQSHESGGIDDILHPFDQFIKFTMVWAPDKIEWFANDTKYHEYLNPDDDYRVWPFMEEFHLIMNLAYGGSWGGYDGVDDTKLPHKLLIDYVRVYQTRESEGPFSLEVIPSEGGTVEINPLLDTYPDSTEVTLTATPDKDYVFNSWKHMSGANPYTFTIRKNTVIMPSFFDPAEYIINGKFHENWDNWTIYIFDDQTAAISPSVIDNVFVPDVTLSPGVNWHAGFQQHHISMGAGEYVLSFDAFADVEEDLLITLAKNYGDYASYIDLTQTISTIQEHYELTLELHTADQNNRLYFGIGEFSGNFYIDNISLKKVRDYNSLDPVNYSSDAYKIYPNPARNHVCIYAANNLIHQATAIQLLDLQGRIIYEGYMSTNKSTIDLSSYKPGIYLVKIHSVESIITQTFIKTN